MNSKVLSLDEWNDIDLPAFGLTFGNFDGVHLGHVHLIAQFVKSCRERSIAPVAFTFVPHPEVYFSPERDHLISSYEYRRKRLFTLGIERLVECDFEKVRCLSGEEFAQLYLLTKPNLRLIWIGHDFTFGKNRVEPQSSMFSNVEVIKNLPVTKENKIISSSLIRELVRLGRTSEVPTFLGRPFEIQGTVIHGKKLGRTIGYPTANIRPHRNVIVPKLGVYSVEVLVDGMWKTGIINVGKNPSIDKEASIKWEVHIMNYSGDLYGKQLRVTFKKFIRPELKFISAEELADQIAKDLKALESDRDDK